MFPIIEYIKDKKVLILGFGREGKSTYSYIRKHLPDKKLTIGDKNKPDIEDENTEVIFGENHLSNQDNFHRK